MKKAKVLSLIAITLLFLHLFSPNIGLMAESSDENSGEMLETDQSIQESAPKESNALPDSEPEQNSEKEPEKESGNQNEPLEPVINSEDDNEEIPVESSDRDQADGKEEEELVEEEEQVEEIEEKTISSLVCNENAGAIYTSEDNAIVVPTTMDDSSINNHTRPQNMWTDEGIVYVAVKATHHLEDMTLNGKNNIGCDKFAATASITVDGQTYNPVDGLKGNTKDAHWTVFKYNLASLGLPETGTYPFFIKGVGGGHDVGGNLLVTIPTIEIEGKKVWIGGDERPEITLQLFRSIGSEAKVFVDSHVVDGNEDSEWTYTWFNKPKYDPYGRQYKYTIDEEEVPQNYTKTVDGLTVKNTYDPTPIPEPTLININVTKEWIGPPATSATFKLLADGNDTGMILVLSEENWSGTFENVSKFKEGTEEEIVYTVEEVKIEGYSTTVTGSASEGFTFTNTLIETETEKKNIAVKKVWDGPELNSVTIKLFADGLDTEKELVLNKETGWFDSFTELEKYQETTGEEIQYTVKEIDVPEDYEVAYSIGGNGEHIVTNTATVTDQGTVRAIYVDEDRTEIADAETYKGKIGESYSTEQKEITGYDFVKVDESGAPALGIFSIEEQTVIYVYKKTSSNSGSLTITKVNENNEVLQGATFELRDSNDNVIDSKTTDENGIIVFESLELDSFSLVETKAPEGYRLLLGSTSVEINTDNLHVEKTMINKKANWNIPKTGGIGTVGFYGVGFILMAVSGWVVFRRQKE